MPDNVIRLAVIGRTGAGKTSFVSDASGKWLERGNSGTSCTTKMQEATLYVDGKEVTLYDTPGLNDSKQQDPRIFIALSERLGESYSRGIRFNGIILMQPINEQIIFPHERRGLELISKIIGENAYSHVAIVTTMWNCVSADYGEQNEGIRSQASGSWNNFLAGGADTLRYHNNKDSALAIVQHIASRLDKYSKVDLQLQTELLKGNNHLDRTSAGKQFEDGLECLLRNVHQQMEETGETAALQAKAERIISWQELLKISIIEVGKFIRKNDKEIFVAMGLLKECIIM